MKKWKIGIFNDSRRFNLDSPNGWNYYFYDLRKEEMHSSGHQMDEGSWPSNGYRWKRKINFLLGRINSKMYITLIVDQFSKYAIYITEGDYTFQQSTLRSVCSNFLFKKIWKFWNGHSLDLNIIENVRLIKKYLCK